jgi:hypothetical protein
MRPRGLVLKNLVLVLACGYILMYYSEHLFWARPRPEDTPLDWLWTWLAYSLAGYVFLAAVSAFRVRALSALFLCGALFGWLVEGVIVQTTYESLPLSISFTGLAWHALISVGVGWYAVRVAMRDNNPLLVGVLLTLIGLCYGFWAVCWWVEPPAVVTPLVGFAAFSFGTTVLVTFAYRLYDWAAQAPFAPPRWLTIVVAILFAGFFLFVAITSVPVALAVLPPLLALVFLTLWKNRKVERRPSLLETLSIPARGWSYPLLFLVPLSATVIYGLSLLLDLRLQTNWVVYLCTTPLGFLALIASSVAVWRRRPD